MDVDIMWATTVRLLQSGLLPPPPAWVPPTPPVPPARLPSMTATIPPLWPAAGSPIINTEPPGPFPPGGWPPIVANDRNPITGAPIWHPPADIRPPLGFPGLNAARPPFGPGLPTEMASATAAEAPGGPPAGPAPSSYPGGSGPTTGEPQTPQPAQGRQIPAEPAQQQPGPPVRRPGSRPSET